MRAHRRGKVRKTQIGKSPSLQQLLAPERQSPMRTKLRSLQAGGSKPYNSTVKTVAILLAVEAAPKSKSVCAAAPHSQPLMRCKGCKRTRIDRFASARPRAVQNCAAMPSQVRTPVSQNWKGARKENPGHAAGGRTRDLPAPPPARQWEVASQIRVVHVKIRRRAQRVCYKLAAEARQQNPTVHYWSAASS
jgi:hypothetical protein